MIFIFLAFASIYKTPLSSKTELFNPLKLSFLLISHKTHLKVAPFALNTAIYSNE